MKISAIEVFPVSFHWKAHYAIEAAASYYRPPVFESVIVQVKTDEGLTGIGEASPVIGVFGENCQGIMDTIKLFETHIKGEDVLKVGYIHTIMDKLVPRSNITAKYAIDTALYDIIGKKLGLPIYSLLGGPQREKVITQFSIAGNKPDLMAKDCQEAISDGFTVLKVKVPGNPVTDLENVLAVMEAVDGKARVAIDVNEAWSVLDTIRIIQNVLKSKYYADNVIIEQPIQAHDLDGLTYITRSSPVPILADESAWTLPDIMEVVKRKAADIVTIKVVEVGGIYRAMQAAAICETGNMPYLIDEACDSKIANTAVAHAALAVGKGIYYAGCTNHLHYEEDIVKKGGVHFDNGYAVLDNKPGLGIEEIDLNLLGKNK